MKARLPATEMQGHVLLHTPSLGSHEKRKKRRKNSSELNQRVTKSDEIPESCALHVYTSIGHTCMYSKRTTSQNIMNRYSLFLIYIHTYMHTAVQCSHKDESVVPAEQSAPGRYSRRLQTPDSNHHHHHHHHALKFKKTAHIAIAGPTSRNLHPEPTLSPKTSPDSQPVSCSTHHLLSPPNSASAQTKL